MTDPRIPDHDEDLDGLGLETLSDGVRPSRSQWAAIEAAAARRNTGRRPWMISAAAAVVLVLAVAGVLVARSGREGPDVSTGFGGRPGDTYVLPPEGSSVIALFADPSTWFIQYADPQGQAWLLSSNSISGMDPSYEGPVPLGAAATVSPFGLTLFTCSYSASAGPGPSAGPAPSDTAPTATGTIIAVEPVRASWGADTQGASLVPVSIIPVWDFQPAPVEQPCVAPTGPDPSLVAQMSLLRRVSFAEWSTFLADNGAVRTTNPPAPPGVVVPASTTTVPEDPPADRGSAEDQIAAAVAAWSRPADDGSFPNLEDGTTKAAEYTGLFDTAAKQSGAAQAGDGTGNASRLSRVRFVTPERASITMELTAKLPTGTFTFPQEGEAILQDGHWVVTYRTVTTTLRRACIPPGGYDGCPSD